MYYFKKLKKQNKKSGNTNVLFKEIQLTITSGNLSIKRIFLLRVGLVFDNGSFFQ